MTTPIRAASLTTAGFVAASRTSRVSDSPRDGGELWHVIPHPSTRDVQGLTASRSGAEGGDPAAVQGVENRGGTPGEEQEQRQRRAADLRSGSDHPVGVGGPQGEAGQSPSGVEGPP